jgi:DNA-binding response OmpR family regulator
MIEEHGALALGDGPVYEGAMKILVVEDEKKVRHFIRQALEEAGMTVDAVESSEDMLLSLAGSRYEVMVLDRLLGGRDSVGVVASLKRAHPEIRVLILSALSEVDDRVVGLTEGADDYLGKPFHVAELVARVRSLGRRAADEMRGERSTAIAYGDLTIDLERQRVQRGGKRIELTGKEFKILCLLARHPGQIFSKTAILDQVWDFNHHPESNIVEVTIANLRSKLERGFGPLIRSRRGVGYWLGEE